MQSRDTTLQRKHLYSLVRSHNGIRPRPFPVFRACLGHKCGEYVFTKKTGAIIHKSERNEKRELKKKTIKRKQRKKK